MGRVITSKGAEIMPRRRDGKEHRCTQRFVWHSSSTVRLMRFSPVRRKKHEMTEWMAQRGEANGYRHDTVKPRMDIAALAGTIQVMGAEGLG